MKLERIMQNDAMSLKVTHDCNMHCDWCIDKRSKVYITMDQVQNALKQGKGAGIKKIFIGGGEPTLHPQILEIAELVEQMGFYQSITTNYTLPDIVKSLDGIVNTIGISYYDQKKLPHQSDYHSELILKVLLHTGRFTREQFDAFITRYKDQFQLDFSTPIPANDWARKNGRVDWLADLQIEKTEILERGSLSQYYRGCRIDRKDIIAGEIRRNLICDTGILVPGIEFEKAEFTGRGDKD
jgi:organic radical activating enzyme